MNILTIFAILISIFKDVLIILLNKEILLETKINLTNIKTLKILLLIFVFSETALGLCSILKPYLLQDIQIKYLIQFFNSSPPGWWLYLLQYLFMNIKTIFIKYTLLIISSLILSWEILIDIQHILIKQINLLMELFVSFKLSKTFGYCF